MQVVKLILISEFFKPDCMFHLFISHEKHGSRIELISFVEKAFVFSIRKRFEHWSGWLAQMLSMVIHPYPIISICIHINYIEY